MNIKEAKQEIINTVHAYLEKDENGNVTESETGTKVTYTNADFAAKVKVVVNKSGKLLPGTGGTGEMIFTVSGVLIAIVAGVVLLNTKRRKRIV